MTPGGPSGAIVLARPWGAAPEAIDAAPIPPASTGLISPDAGDRPTHLPPKLCLRPAGGVSILCEDANPPVQPRGRALIYRNMEASALTLPRPAGVGVWRIRDAVVAQDAAIVIEDRDGRRLLRRIAADGADAWSVEAEVAVLRCDGSGGLYAVASGPGAPLIKLDAANGELTPCLRADWTDPPVINAAGTAFFVDYDPASRRRRWNSLDATGHATVVVADEAAYGFLADVVGADDTGRAYGVLGAEIACIGRDGAIAWRASLGALGVEGRVQWTGTWAFDPKGVVFVASQTPETLVVTAVSG